MLTCTTGTRWSGERITSSPFGSVYFSKGIDGAATRRTSARSCMRRVLPRVVEFCQTQAQVAVDLVQLLVKLGDFDLGLHVDAVIGFATDAILRVLPVLAHHDDRRLQGGQRGETEIEQD